MIDAVVIGAGLGGLAAAIELAHAGRRVRVLEAGPRAGGKAGEAEVDGVRFDTGPSVLTLPAVAAALLARGGLDLRARPGLRALSPAFRYRWPDGAALDVHHDPAATLASVRAALGPAAEAELAGFLRYAAQIWDAAAPHFVLGPAPTFGRLLGLGLGQLALVTRIDPLRSMAGGIRARVREPHLITLLERYATYNGSDPRQAPATLNCIAHVELALGGYGVQGGISALVDALVEVAEGLGVELRLGSPAARLRLDGRRVTGVEGADGAVHEAGIVVVNADVAHLIEDLLPASAPHGLPKAPPPSMSGWTAVLRARRRAGDRARVAHEVLFPEVYADEFADIFDRDRPPEAPTVYTCAQEACHGRPGWAEHEPLFVMANAPPEPRGAARPPEVWAALQERVLARLRGAGLIDADDAVVWTRTPTDLARELPGSRGAIYGAASNDRFAAFARPGNEVARLPGLFLASGGAHPGGGMPLAMQSGRLAAAAALGLPAPTLPLGSA